MHKIPFTREGFLKLKAEYEDLVGRRPAAVADLKSAREKGDLSENSAYRAAKSKLFSIDNRLRRTKVLLDKAEVIENQSAEFADIGNYVTVSGQDNEERIFRLVNTFESDLDNRQISSFSPLGKALMGKKINDEVKFNTPSGTKTYLIKKITLDKK